MPCRGNASAGFAGDDQGSDRGIGEVQSLGEGGFSESESVGRGATDDGAFVIEKVAQSGRGGHSSGGQHEAAQVHGGFESAPEADEGPERERDEDAIGGSYAGDFEHDSPAFFEPGPAFRGVEPA